MKGVRLGIVVSKFNGEITEAMLQVALKHATAVGANVRYVCKVPGAFDIPLFVQALLEKDDVDAVATLGAIVKGETMHDEIIGHQIGVTLTKLSLKHRKPVTLGVAGPGMSWEQGIARKEEYAVRAVEAAVNMAHGHKALLEMRAGTETIQVE